MSRTQEISRQIEALQEEVDRFAVLRYADFCLALRQFVVANKHDKRGYVFLSFVLALAATIEIAEKCDIGDSLDRVVEGLQSSLLQIDISDVAPSRRRGCGAFRPTLR